MKFLVPLILISLALALAAAVPASPPLRGGPPPGSLRDRIRSRLQNDSRWKDGFTARLDFEEFDGKKSIRKNSWNIFMSPAHQIRLESVEPGKPVAVADLEQQTFLLILPARKLALSFDEPPRFLAREGMPLFSFIEDAHRQLMEKEGKPDGTETMNGISTDRFQIKRPDSVVTFWLNRETRFPAKIQREFMNGRKTVLTVSQVDLKPKLDASRFAAPPGFKPVVVLDIRDPNRIGQFIAARNLPTLNDHGMRPQHIQQFTASNGVVVKVLYADPSNPTHWFAADIIDGSLEIPEPPSVQPRILERSNVQTFSQGKLKVVIRSMLPPDEIKAIAFQLLRYTPAP